MYDDWCIVLLPSLSCFSRTSVYKTIPFMCHDGLYLTYLSLPPLAASSCAVDRHITTMSFLSLYITIYWALLNGQPVVCLKSIVSHHSSLFSVSKETFPPYVTVVASIPLLFHCQHLSDFRFFSLEQVIRALLV